MQRLLWLSVWIALGSAGAAAAQPPRDGGADGASPLRRATAASTFATIQGNALDALDRPLPNYPVRLRNARTGRVVGQQLTDDAGLFSFTNVDPGSYIVELVGDNLRVEATSALLPVDAGDVVSTVVQLPGRRRVVGWFGDSVGHAAAVIAGAAGAGVLAVNMTGEDISPD